MNWKLVIFLALAGCGRSGFVPNNSAPRPSSGHAPRTDESAVCFQGQSAPKCLDTEEFAGHPLADEDYLYADPQTSQDFPDSQDPQQYRIPQRVFNLNLIALDAWISPNFRASEFMSKHKGPLGILAPALIEHLQNIRDRLQVGINIHSGYRSPGYNDGISGSAKWSRHMYGDAVDMSSSNASLNKLMNECAKEDGFRLLYSGHVHCDFRYDELNSTLFGPVLTHAIAAKAIRARMIEAIQINRQVIGQEQIFYLEGIPTEDPSDQIVIQWKFSLIDGTSFEREQFSPHLPADLVVDYVNVQVGGEIEKRFIMTHE